LFACSNNGVTPTTAALEVGTPVAVYSGLNTFGSDGFTPAGTVFYISVVAKSEDTSFFMFRLEGGFDTAELEIDWPSSSYARGEVLRAQTPRAGSYHLAAQGNAATTFDQIVSAITGETSTRITFRSGTVIDSWYVLPVR
jgi:hypothetical protein